MRGQLDVVRQEGEEGLRLAASLARAASNSTVDFHTGGWVAKKAKKYCKTKTKSKETGENAFEACPDACGTCDFSCDEDSESWYMKKEKKDCSWVAKKAKKYCKKASAGVFFFARAPGDATRAQTFTAKVKGQKIKTPIAMACPETCEDYLEDKGIWCAD